MILIHRLFKIKTFSISFLFIITINSSIWSQGPVRQTELYNDVKDELEQIKESPKDSILQYLDKKFVIAQENKDLATVRLIAFEKAIIYDFMLDLDGLYEMSNLCIDISEKLENPKEECKILLVGYYYEVRDMEKGKALALEIEKEALENKDTSLLIYVDNFLGMIMEEMSDNEQALNYYLKGIKYAEASDNLISCLLYTSPSPRDS